MLLLLNSYCLHLYCYRRKKRAFLHLECLIHVSQGTLFMWWARRCAQILFNAAQWTSCTEKEVTAVTPKKEKSLQIFWSLWIHIKMRQEIKRMHPVSMKMPIGLGVVVVFLTESSYTCVLVFCAQDWLWVMKWVFCCLQVPTGVLLNTLQKVDFNVFDPTLTRGVCGISPLWMQLQLKWNSYKGTY